MVFCRFISDTHGLHKEHLELTKGCEYTIQLGDYGYESKILRDNLRIGKDFAISGNHQCYDSNSPEYCLKQPFDLGDYGILELPDFPPIFYVRGGWSIDWKWRKRIQEWPQNGPKTWFVEEELTEMKLREAVELYKTMKPKFVISHEAPTSIVTFVTDPNFVLNFGYEPGVIKTRTSLALQEMFEFHQPKYHIFGHYHSRKQFEVNGTTFICLDMLGKTLDNRNAYVDFEKGYLN